MLPRLVDAGLEASVVGSFSRFGPAVRRRLEGWDEPAPALGATVVVTGATSGLGLAAATALVACGVRVCLVGRDQAKLERVEEELGRTGSGSASLERADLLDLSASARLADRVALRYGRIDALVHVAGALFPTLGRSAEGIEATVTLNLLSPYVITERLLAKLERSAPTKVITMTSGGLYTQRLDLDRLAPKEDEAYSGPATYARTKRAQLVLTHEWQRRYGRRGVSFHCVHPGWAATPGLAAGLPRFASSMRPLLRSPKEGSDTLVWLCTGPPGRAPGGHLWLDRRPRGEYRLPWTWVPTDRRASEGAELWEWCQRQVAPFVGALGER